MLFVVNDLLDARVVALAHRICLSMTRSLYLVEYSNAQLLAN